MPPKFGGGNTCETCKKTVYLQEQLAFEGFFYHQQCFKCSICNEKISTTASAGAMHGTVSHKLCFKKQFRETGGKYGGEKVTAGALSGDKTEVIAPVPTPSPKATPAPANQSEPVKAPEPVKEPEPAKVAEPVKQPEPNNTSPAKAVMPVVKPAAITKQTNKVFVENYDGKVINGEPVVVVMDGEEGVKTGVFVGNCKGPNLVIKIEGKCKNITINNCSDMAVVFDTCITTVEMIGSKKVQVQAAVAGGSYIVDKCDRTSLYLADSSLEDQVVVYTCQSTSTVVYQSTADGEDQVEHGIPNQILSTFVKDTAPTHKEVVPDAE